MARTPYDEGNAKHSEDAHLAARRLLYPIIFGVSEEHLEYKSVASQETEHDRILDSEMGIDRLIKVSIPNLLDTLNFTIQERFRRRYQRDETGKIVKDYMTFNDITITEWNHASDLPSELYKISAGYFIYAYYDDPTDTFFRPIMVNTSDLLLAIVKNRITPGYGENKKNQTFVTFTYGRLVTSGLVVFYDDRVPGDHHRTQPVVTTVGTTPHLM